MQDLIGTERHMRALQQAHPSQRGPLSVSLELQPDCFAGVWRHAAYDQGKVNRTDIVAALDAAAAVGDDRIQRATRGRLEANLLRANRAYPASTMDTRHSGHENCANGG